MDTEPQTVDVYWRPGCGFCVLLRLRLRKSSLPLRWINIWDDRDAAARVRAVTGGSETVPTVIIGDRGLVNPSVSQIEELVAEVAPTLREGGR